MCTVQTDSGAVVTATKKVIIEKVSVNANYAYLDIVIGEEIPFDSLFTVTTNTGDLSGVTIRYIINGEETYVNTGHLERGQHTLICQAILDDVVDVDSARVIITVEYGIETLDETTILTDTLGNKYVVPGGFSVRTDLATNVEDGMVIEDWQGNQFVWVPIGNVKKSDGSTVNIEFGRYEEFSVTATPAQYASDYASVVAIDGDTTEDYPYRESTYDDGNINVGYIPRNNATAVDLAGFISNAQKYGGYYIARYEASFGSGATPYNWSTGVRGITNQKPYFKPSTIAGLDKETDEAYGTTSPEHSPGVLWNWVRQGDASLVCQNLYAGNEHNSQNFVECDLVNSYAWDTAVIFILKCEDETYSSTPVTGGTLQNTGTTSDIKCNIYDLKENLDEWTTEYNPNPGLSQVGSCVRRSVYSYGASGTARFVWDCWSGKSDIRFPWSIEYFLNFRETTYLRDVGKKTSRIT